MVFLLFACAFLAACSSIAFKRASAASKESALIFISSDFDSARMPVLLINDMGGWVGV